MVRRFTTAIVALIAVAAFATGHPGAQTSAPVISGVSGTLTDGGTLQISGSGFGAKATVAPLKWDDFERGANGAGLTNWAFFGTQPTFSSTVKRAKSNMSARANFVGGAWNSGFGVENMALPRIYLDAWYWLDASSPYSRNHKLLRVMSGGGAEPHLAYVMFCNGAGYLTSTVSASDGQWTGLGPSTFTKRWSHIQGYFQESSPGAKDGVMRMWVDGELAVDKAVATRTSSATRWESIFLGQYFGHDADADCAAYGDAYTYWDDVYLDTTQARVEIGDASTYATSRHREIQLPTAWSGSSITITLNEGTFPGLSGLYLYVTDSAGRVNSNGFPLAPGTDTTPPSVTSSAPANGTTGVAMTTKVTATFSEAMTASTISTSTFVLTDPGGAVGATVAYDAATRVATLTPTAQLDAATTYTARVKGGTSGVKDAAGNALAADAVWSFTTVAAEEGPAPPPSPVAGLVAAFSFNEATGTSAHDASGRNNTGTLAGGVKRSQAGKHGGALSLDGVDDWVTVADAASLDLTAGMTIEAWVNPATLSGWRTVIMKETAGGLAYVLYANDNVPKPAAYVRMAGRSNSDGTGGSAALPLNVWTHLAATYDGATVRLYVNGSAAGSAATSGSIVTSTLPLRIGGNAVWGEYFHGLIDEVRIYNRALSAAEIQADMTTPIGGIVTPPAAPSNLRIVP
jgi:hypothetical protein